MPCLANAYDFVSTWITCASIKRDAEAGGMSGPASPTIAPGIFKFEATLQGFSRIDSFLVRFVSSRDEA
jgi:hypothetical protein